MQLLLTCAITITLILLLMSGWILVQHMARRYAARHPEFGPAREEGGGCSGIFCHCTHREDCKREKLLQTLARDRTEI